MMHLIENIAPIAPVNAFLTLSFHCVLHFIGFHIKERIHKLLILDEVVIFLGIWL